MKALKAPSSGINDKCKESITKHLSVCVCARNASYVSLNTVWPSVSAMVVTACLSDRAKQQS